MFPSQLTTLACARWFVHSDSQDAADGWTHAGTDESSIVSAEQITAQSLSRACRVLCKNNQKFSAKIRFRFFLRVSLQFVVVVCKYPTHHVSLYLLNPPIRLTSHSTHLLSTFLLDLHVSSIRDRELNVHDVNSLGISIC